MLRTYVAVVLCIVNCVAAISSTTEDQTEPVTPATSTTPPNHNRRRCSNDPTLWSIIDRQLQTRAICPWIWTTTFDENRVPASINEARCLCERVTAPLGGEFDCEEVTMTMQVRYSNTGDEVHTYDLAVACVGMPVVQLPPNLSPSAPIGVVQQARVQYVEQPLFG